MAGFWSPKHKLQACTSCESSIRRHGGRGLCTACYNRQHRQANIESYRQYAREAQRKIRAQDRAADNERLRQWRLGHHYAFIGYKAALRATRAGVDGEATAEAIEARVKYYGGKCYLCGDETKAIDHLIPLSRGGPNWPANIRPCCKSCNSKKQRRTLAEYQAGVPVVPRDWSSREWPPLPKSMRWKDDAQNLVTALRLKQERLGLTQRQIAGLTGLHESTISRILRGRRLPLTPSRKRILAAFPELSNG